MSNPRSLQVALLWVGIVLLQRGGRSPAPSPLQITTTGSGSATALPQIANVNPTLTRGKAVESWIRRHSPSFVEYLDYHILLEFLGT